MSTKIEMDPAVTIEKVLVTPEVAARWLKLNVKNRPLSKDVIKRHAEAMQRGLWRPNPAEPISFAWDGTLVNGQHRLNAVIKSGCSVSMYMLQGADPADFDVIDTGKTRGAGDIIALVGIPNSRNIASAIKAYFELKKGHFVNTAGGIGHAKYRGRPAFNKDYEEEALSDCDFWVDICRYAKAYNKSAHYVPMAFMSGMTAYLVKERHEDLAKITAFFDEIKGLTQSNVIALLRNRLVSDAALGNEDRKMKARMKQKLIIKTWNIWRKGQDRTHLLIKDGENVWFD